MILGEQEIGRGFLKKDKARENQATQKGHTELS